MKKLIVAAGLVVGAAFALPAPTSGCPAHSKQTQATKETKQNAKESAKAKSPKKPPNMKI